MKEGQHQHSATSKIGYILHPPSSSSQLKARQTSAAFLCDHLSLVIESDRATRLYF